MQRTRTTRQRRRGEARRGEAERVEVRGLRTKKRRLPTWAVADLGGTEEGREE